MDIDISNKLNKIEEKIDKTNEQKEEQDNLYKIFNGKMVIILFSIVVILLLLFAFPNVLHKSQISLLERDFDKCEYQQKLFSNTDTFYCYKTNYTITEIQCVDTYCRINGYMFQRLKE